MLLQKQNLNAMIVTESLASLPPIAYIRSKLRVVIIGSWNKNITVGATFVCRHYGWRWCSLVILPPIALAKVEWKADHWDAKKVEWRADDLLKSC